jgi:hypothetical protein
LSFHTASFGNGHFSRPTTVPVSPWLWQLGTNASKARCPWDARLTPGKLTGAATFQAFAADHCREAMTCFMPPSAFKAESGLAFFF